MKKCIFLLTIVLLQGCSQKAISYINQDAKFEQFETFRIVSVQLDGRKLSTESTGIFEAIKKQIVDQMTNRSYVQSNITPDLTLRYELNSAVKSERNDNSFNNSFAYPNFDINSRTIKESIILLELSDAKKKLVWQGSYDLKQENRGTKASKSIQNAIDKIFISFPYKAGSKAVHQELTSIKKSKND